MTVNTNFDKPSDLSKLSTKTTAFQSAVQSITDPWRHQQKIKRQIMVRWLKRIFIAVPVFVSISFFVWFEISKRHEQSAPFHQDFKDDIRIQNRLSAPRLHSIDEKGRPYSLKAKTALQQDKQITHLDAPQSTMAMSDGSTLKIYAHRGFYNDVTKILEYQDEVILQTNSGYQFKTAHAFVNLQKKEAFGDQQVIGVGPAGKIWSQGFEADETGVMRFKGKSRLVIDQINLESIKTEKTDAEKEKP